MVSLNRSFFFGICFASFTWGICLYLLSQLNLKDTPSSKLVSSHVKQTFEGNHPVEDVIQSNDIFEQEKNGKYAYGGKNDIEIKKSFKSYVNSDNLIKKLQPIVVKPEGVDNNLLELGMVRNKQDRTIRDEGYKLHAYNVLISNQLSYHRPIPDTRNKLCEDINYPQTLPTATIIICFYNEHYPTLLRTVHSIVDRSPKYLLKEIMLIDDFSDIENLHSNLKTYIANNFNDLVKLYKTERREGLIRARIFGARKATGDIIIFLDSHIEVNVDWIQPLLSRIKENRTNVVMPIIDIINADTFAYTASPLVRGGFNWGLHFKWENLPTGTLVKDKDFVKPIKSPTMAGGLFAMDRKYFKDLGEYDAGMNIWGGENLEISFRIWMCGGQLELIPCSRVGHIFRKRRPYGDPDGKDTMLHNSLRVAHVWMDDYKDHFISQQRAAAREDYGDISSRIQLRRELKCHDFDWYIKNVYPELTLPTDDEERLKKKWGQLEQDKFQPWHSRKRDYVGHFQLRLSNTSLCIQSQKDIKSKGSRLVLKTCIRSKNQIWYETTKHELVLAQLLCLNSDNTNPYLYKCHEMGADQEWKHKGEDKSPIYNMAAGTCLGVEKNEIDTMVIMKLCNEPTLNMWDFVR